MSTHYDYSCQIEPAVELRQKTYNWQFSPTGDYWEFSLYLAHVPCWFHRLMQRLIFGFRYRRVDGK